MSEDFHILRERANLRSVVLVALFVLLSCFDFMILLSSISTDATWSISLGNYFGACIFLWITAWPCIFSIFHLHKSQIRYFVPFVLAGCYLAFFYILTANMTWTYSTAHQVLSGDGDIQTVTEQFSNSNLVAGSTLSYTVAVICFGFIVACMFFNVSSLRMTKAILDKVLSKLRDQIQSIQRDIEREEKAQALHSEATRFSQRSIELINLCRPVFRPYALAIALAEPQQPTTTLDQPAGYTGAAFSSGGSPNTLKLPQHKKRSSAGSGRNRLSAKSQSAGSKDEVSILSQEKRPSAGAEEKEQSKSATGGPMDVSPKAGPVKHQLDTDPSASGGGKSPSGDDIVHPLSDADKGHRPTNSLTPSKSNKLESPTKTIVVSPKPPRAKLPTTSVPSSKSAALPLVNGSDFALVHTAKKDAAVVGILKELRDFNFTEALPVITNVASLSPLSPAAVHQRVQAEIRLPHLFSHPVTVELLKDTLAKQLSPENVAFWLGQWWSELLRFLGDPSLRVRGADCDCLFCVSWSDIQRYRSLDTVAARRAVADEIFQLYIVNGARFEVNISSHQKESLSSKLARGRMGLDLFDDVEREVYRLMGTNNFAELMGSPTWSKVAAVLLGQKDYALKNVVPVTSGGRSVSASHVVGYSSGGGVSQPVARLDRLGSRGPQTHPVGSKVVGEASLHRPTQALLAGSAPASRRPSFSGDDAAHGLDGVMAELKKSDSPLIVAGSSPQLSPYVPPTAPSTRAPNFSLATHVRVSPQGASTPKTSSSRNSPLALAAPVSSRMTPEELDVEARRLMYPQSNIVGGGDAALELEVDRLVHPGGPTSTSSTSTTSRLTDGSSKKQPSVTTVNAAASQPASSSTQSPIALAAASPSDNEPTPV